MDQESELTQLKREDYFTYREAADFLLVSLATVNNATAAGVIPSYKIPKFGYGSKKYILRSDMEAIKGHPINSAIARTILNDRRRVRGELAEERRFNEDGTNNWRSEGLINDVLEALKIIAQQQEQMLKSLQEADDRAKRVAERLLSLPPGEMLKELARGYMESRS